MFDDLDPKSEGKRTGKRKSDRRPAPPWLAYTVNEAAEAVRLSVRQIYKELDDERLVSLKVGRRTLISREELKRWLKTRPHASRTRS